MTPKFLLAAVGLLGGLASAQTADLAIVDVTVHASPDAPALEHASVLITGGKISQVGTHVAVPKGVKVLTCKGCVAFAGFWNNHVHFSDEQRWDAKKPAAELNASFVEMLTHSGFTSVVDTGSNPYNTVALRARVEKGELLGPTIRTAGGPLYPPHAIPYYLGDLPKDVLAMLPQPATAAAAAEVVKQEHALGTDLVKLFTGSYVKRGKVTPMSVETAKGAVAEAHAEHMLVFAHPSNLAGTRVAIDSGVDVLAHAPDTTEGITDAVLKDAVAHHMSMVPTLKLFTEFPGMDEVRKVVLRFHQLGGPLLFGTDTGYLKDFSVTEEYHQLALTGLKFADVLAMLTTAPAHLFGVEGKVGKLQPGMDGDVTLLRDDPATGSLERFADVAATISHGRVLMWADPEAKVTK